MSKKLINPNSADYQDKTGPQKTTVSDLDGYQSTSDFFPNLTGAAPSPNDSLHYTDLTAPTLISPNDSIHYTDLNPLPSFEVTLSKALYAPHSDDQKINSPDQATLLSYTLYAQPTHPTGSTIQPLDPSYDADLPESSLEQKTSLIKLTTSSQDSFYDSNLPESKLTPDDKLVRGGLPTGITSPRLPINSLDSKHHKINFINLLGLDLGSHYNSYLTPRCNFVFQGNSNFAIFHEEKSKQMGFQKGYTTINITYQSHSQKNLFDCYYDEIKHRKISPNLSFAIWASVHFSQTKKPDTWHGSDFQWQKTKNLYKQVNLISLTKEERVAYESKFINGYLYIRTTHPHHPYDPAKPEEKTAAGWKRAHSSFAPLVSFKVNSLIYVLAEKEIIVNGMKTYQKVMYLGKDKPGCFHHTSFTNQRILCAGSIMINDGVIVKIDAESGHFRPNQDRFFDVISYLSAHNAKFSNNAIGHWRHKHIEAKYPLSEITNKKTGKTYTGYSDDKSNTKMNSKCLSTDRFFSKSTFNTVAHKVEEKQTQRLKEIFSSKKLKPKPVWAKRITSPTI